MTSLSHNAKILWEQLINLVLCPSTRCVCMLVRACCLLYVAKVWITGNIFIPQCFIYLFVFINFILWTWIIFWFIYWIVNRPHGSLCSALVSSNGLFVARFAGATFGFYPFNAEPEKTCQWTNPQWCIWLKLDIIIYKGFVSTFLFLAHFWPLSSIYLSILRHCFLSAYWTKPDSLFHPDSCLHHVVLQPFGNAGYAGVSNRCQMIFGVNGQTVTQKCDMSYMTQWWLFKINSLLIRWWVVDLYSRENCWNI